MKGKTTEQLARIANAGGGFRLSAKDFSVDQLARIANATGQKPSRIEITDCELLGTNQLARIAQAGNGSVFFIG